jgi:predicted porin
MAAWFQLEIGTANALGGQSTAGPTTLGGWQGLTYRNSAIGLKGNSWGSFLMGIWDTPLTVAFGQASLVPKFLSVNAMNNQAGFFGTNPFVGGGTFSGTSEQQACTVAFFAASGGNCLTATTNMDRRQATSLQYWTPNWGGFEGRFLFSPSTQAWGSTFQNQATAAGQPDTYSPNVLHPYIWGLSLNYSNGGLFLSYSYQRHVDLTAAGVRSIGGITLNNTGGGNSVTMSNDMSASTDQDHRLGAKYKFDSGFGIGARYEQQISTYSYANAPAAGTSDLTGWRKRTWEVSGSYETGPHAIMLVYAHTPSITVSGTGGAGTAAATSMSGSSTNANEYIVGYDYALSKRTDLRAYFTQVKNAQNARYTGSVFNGIGTVAGGDPRYIGVGLRHAF